VTSGCRNVFFTRGQVHEVGKSSTAFVHNGAPYAAYVKHLTDAGLTVSEAHADTALAIATTGQPDIIVLDLDCDGDVVSQLKGAGLTMHIPIIALAELLRRERD
jgi:DNA-binding response OmpR family regulator